MWNARSFLPLAGAGCSCDFHCCGLCVFLEFCIFVKHGVLFFRILCAPWSLHDANHMGLTSATNMYFLLATSFVVRSEALAECKLHAYGSFPSLDTEVGKTLNAPLSIVLLKKRDMHVSVLSPRKHLPEFGAALQNLVGDGGCARGGGGGS